MPTVRILPELIINQIAAGEVVERPASIVKELVENAIDAKATQIAVTVKNGGKDLICVLDDGIGMDESNARLAVERHATSKIYEEPDLFNIQTLGFRGEALASIASVSHFDLMTCHDEQQGGTRLTIKGGHLDHVGKVGFPRGTKMTIEHLFFNTPARLKFMKTVPTEMQHIQNAVTNQALAHPEIQFKLIHNQQVIFNLPKNQELPERVYSLFGESLHQGLVPVNHEETYLSYQGLVQLPSFAKQSKRWQYLFVNQRFVKCPSANHAIYQAYQSLLGSSQHPAYFLNINLDPSEIDVNVHPAKTEIRFRNSKLLHTILVDHLRRQLMEVGNRRYFGKTLEPRESQLSLFKAKSKIPPKRTKSRPLPMPTMPVKQPVVQAKEQQKALKTLESISKQTPPKPVTLPPAKPKVSQVLQKDVPFKEWFSKVIGQFDESYLVAEGEDGLFLIDQHVAHERILFEAYQKAFYEESVPTVRFDVPQLLELSPQQGIILEQYLLTFEKLGFVIESFGGNTYSIQQPPWVLDTSQVPQTIEACIEPLSAFGKRAKPEEVAQDIMRQVACHAAIPSKMPLEPQEMTLLMTQLHYVDPQQHRPHGRALWIPWSYEEIEKRLKSNG